MGCKLYIERPAGDLVESRNSFNSNGSARFTVASDVTTQITVFVKDGGFDLDGPGLVNETQQPEKFQLYVTGNSSIGGLISGHLAQTATFYGVVYVEDTDANGSGAGDIYIERGSENGVPSSATYYGAFVAGGYLVMSDAATSYSVTMHYDESLRGLPLDGSGRIAASTDLHYRIRLWQNR